MVRNTSLLLIRFDDIQLNPGPIHKPASVVDPYKSLGDVLGHNNLNIGHLNVNGILEKLSDIRYLLQEVNFDILGITESHLSEDIRFDYVPGYDTRMLPSINTVINIFKV